MKINSKILQLFRLPVAQEDRIVLLICFGLAFLFWLIVKLEGTFDKDIDVQLSYQLAENEAFAELPPSKARATVSGEGWTLLQPDPAIQLNIDLSESNQRFVNSSFLKSEVAQKLRFLGVDRIVPEYFDLKIEPKVQRKVPIFLRDSISVAPEHFLQDSIQISPDSVWVTGPISVVNALEYWETKLLRKENLDTSLQDSLSLRADKNGILQMEPQKIEVTVNVERYTEKSFFVPVTVEHDFDSLIIFPNKIRLNVSVGLGDFNSISEKDFVLEADIKTATRTGDNNTAPLLITKRPISVRSVHFSPKAVEFFIYEKEKDNITEEN